jgi:N-methylhydantoinase B
MTSVAAVSPHKADRLIWKSQNTAGADQSNASGIHGGYPGAGSHVSVARSTQAWERLAASKIALSYEDFGSEVEHLPTKSEGVLGRDDVLLFFPPGGGGFGDPLDREPSAVLADVLAGSVTIEGARRHYGVVIVHDAVDATATEQLRLERRADRLGSQPSFDNWAMLEGAVPQRRFGHSLEIVAVDGAQLVRCERCGFPLGDAREDPRQAARQRSVPLREAGPWLSLRYGGMSPNFHLVESYCPGCATLIDVEERRT